MDDHKDPGYLRFRQGSVKLGCLTTVTAAALIAPYLVATWGQKAHRAPIVALLGVALLSVILMLALRAERIVETRWCDAFFASWSGTFIVIITVFALLDGGPASPLAMLFFPVLVFAGLCYPLRLAVAVGMWGVIAFAATAAFTSFHHAEATFFVAGCLAMTAVMCGWQAHTLERGRRELARASRTDHLTGSLNRRGFHEHAQVELARAFRAGEPVALVLVDLDGFKAVNDVHGHAAGDELLCWVVEQMRVGLRPSDVTARLGGDEFALVLPGIDVDSARPVVDRLRAALGERTSASFGIAAYPDQADPEAMLAHADAQLYAEKRDHRGTPQDLSRVQLYEAESFWQ